MPTAALRQQKVHRHLEAVLYQVRQAAYRTKHPIPEHGAPQGLDHPELFDRTRLSYLEQMPERVGLLV